MVARRTRDTVVPAALVGMPLRVAVLVLPVEEVAERVTPLGRVPEATVRVGAGCPVAVTVKVPAVAAVKLVVAADVKAGTTCTVRVAAFDVAVFVALAATARYCTPFIAAVIEETVSVSEFTPE